MVNLLKYMYARCIYNALQMKNNPFLQVAILYYLNYSLSLD